MSEERHVNEKLEFALPSGVHEVPADDLTRRLVRAMKEDLPRTAGLEFIAWGWVVLGVTLAVLGEGYAWA